ncbi:hypothetical protein ACT89R_29875 (plasmid) [Rhodococcus qingshengii]
MAPKTLEVGARVFVDPHSLRQGAKMPVLAFVVLTVMIFVLLVVVQRGVERL